MALDTKYRPLTYDDVLGQESAVAVLRQYVKEGKGFHQSYVFCGQHGSGKTTMGRILARALLCHEPVDGNPCDQCPSCRIFLDGGVHESFEELDAASKSRVADLERIIEDIDYSTFNGKRRIYLFDESHQLSKKALDILLKPMEDNVEGSEDKKLVCIFATTEPAKMRSTIFSRCAPAFVIRVVEPEGIAKRLAWVCDQEGLEYDEEALVTIAEVEECHIRDALKTVEGVSMLGSVTRENTFQYLQLGANDLALSILEAVGADIPQAVELATQMAKAVSPSSSYERLAEGAMCAYRAHLGVGKIPAQWNREKMTELAARGEALLGIASRFSVPPHRPNQHTLILDVAAVHYALVGKVPPTEMAKLVVQVEATPHEQSAKSPENPPAATVSPASQRPEPSPSEPVPEKTSNAGSAGTVSSDGKDSSRLVGGVWVDDRAVGKGPLSERAEVGAVAPGGDSDELLQPDLFCTLVQHYLKGMSGGRKGRQG